MRHTLPVTLTLVVLVTLTVLAACAPTTPEPSSSSATVLLPKPTDTTVIIQPAQILGVWQVYSTDCTPGYMVIRGNGTYTWSCQPDGSSGVSGKYHFANGKFVVLNNVCGAEGQYQINGSDPAANPRTLTFTLVKDNCDLDIKTLTAQKAVWVAAEP